MSKTKNPIRKFLGYVPSLKSMQEATIVEGKAIESKGGSIRYTLRGEYKGRKTLPKTVTKYDFENLYGFDSKAAEAVIMTGKLEGQKGKVNAFHKVGEKDTTGFTPETIVPVEKEDDLLEAFRENAVAPDGTKIKDLKDADTVGSPSPASVEPSAPSETPFPQEPSNENFSAENTCAECSEIVADEDIIGDGTNRGLCCVPDYYDEEDRFGGAIVKEAFLGIGEDEEESEEPKTQEFTVVLQEGDKLELTDIEDTEEDAPEPKEEDNDSNEENEEKEAEEGTRTFKITDIWYDTYDEEAEEMQGIKPFYDKHGYKQSHDQPDPSEMTITLDEDEGWEDRDLDMELADAVSDESGFMVYHYNWDEVNENFSAEMEEWNYVNFEETQDGLKLTSNGLWGDDVENAADLLEDVRANSDWEWLTADQLGALSEADVLAQGSYSDDGEFEPAENVVYAYTDYQISDWFNKLKDNGVVVFKSFPVENGAFYQDAEDFDFVGWIPEAENPDNCFICGKSNQGFEGNDNVCTTCHESWEYDEGGEEGEGYYLKETKRAVTAKVTRPVKEEEEEKEEEGMSTLMKVGLGVGALAVGAAVLGAEDSDDYEDVLHAEGLNTFWVREAEDVQKMTSSEFVPFDQITNEIEQEWNETTIPVAAAYEPLNEPTNSNFSAEDEMIDRKVAQGDITAEEGEILKGITDPIQKRRRYTQMRRRSDPTFRKDFNKEAETLNKICKCKDNETCYWCVTDCQGCEKAFTEDHLSNDCQVCDKFFCDDCILPMQYYEDNEARVCEPCLEKYPQFKGDFAEHRYEREAETVGSPSPSGPSSIPEPAEATGSEPSNENMNAESKNVKMALGITALGIGVAAVLGKDKLTKIFERFGL